MGSGASNIARLLAIDVTDGKTKVTRLYFDLHQKYFARTKWGNLDLDLSYHCNAFFNENIVL